MWFDADDHRESVAALLTSLLAGLTVLHMDKDFEIIAAITGQPLERLDIA